MNIEQIKAFHKVASTGSFTRAARELFVTQPAVSHEIKALESSLGVTLFDRSAQEGPNDGGGRDPLFLHPPALCSS